MRVLADTSVWVDFLRGTDPSAAQVLDRLLAAGEVVMCGPVAAELFAGTAEERAPELWSLLAGLRWVELGRAQWREVGETSSALRRRGATVPLTDLVIAVAALAARASLWSRDSDFDRVGEILPALERFAPPKHD